MNLAIAIGIFVLVVTVVVVIATVRYLRTQESSLPDELVARRKAVGEALDEIVERMPDRPKLKTGELPDHPQAASIEAKLIAENAQGALAEAEKLLVSSPGDARVHVLLGRVLLHCGELDAASYEIDRARALGGGGPMLDYLEGRAHHMRIVRETNRKNVDIQTSPVPSLITPFEMFILKLERQRQQSSKAAALWLASLQSDDAESVLTHDRIVELVTDHFSAYYESLEMLTAAARAEPGFTDALYHIARVALKVGFVNQGMALMDKLEPLMESSPERRYYLRDLAELRDEELPTDLEPMPAVPPTAKRSVRLKVLN